MGSSSSSADGGSTATVTVDKVIVNGSDPENDGPVDLYQGTGVILRAKRTPLPADGPWPEKNPVWTVDPPTDPNGAYLRTLGAATGPTIELLGYLPPGINGAQFIVTATCCDSSDSIQVNLKRCDAITFVSASNGFVRKSDSFGVVNVVGIRKGGGETTTLTISVTPDTPASYQKISWEGATVVPGSNNLQATVPVDIAERKIVKVFFEGHPCQEIWVWPIWVSLTVRIAGELSTDNGAEAIQPEDPKPFGWPDIITYPNTQPYAFGGGTSLGPIDHYATPSYQHAITGGRVEIAGITKPDLVWIFGNGLSWSMKREVLLEKIWDNGQHCSKPARDPQNPDVIICDGTWESGPLTIVDENDTSNSLFVDLDPAGNGKLFDLDIPACPPIFGLSIQHTSEVYVNFNQWAEVDFGSGSTVCSEIEPWSYSAQVDGDAQQVLRNELQTQHIPETNMISHFTPR